MARIAKRLAGPLQLAGTTATLYTVPAVTKTIVRHIHIANPTGGAVTVTMGIGVDGATTRIFDAYSIAAGAVLDHFAYYVLEAAETFRGHASAATSLVATIDGDEIVLG